jgi:hypothetical protein
MKPTLTVPKTSPSGKLPGGRPGLSVDEALEAGRAHRRGATCRFPICPTGQRRRIAHGQLLVNWRPVWLLDEPTAASTPPRNAFRRSGARASGAAAASSSPRPICRWGRRHEAAGIRAFTARSRTGMSPGHPARYPRSGVRAGGGMLIGILFFLAVIAVVPSASARISTCWRASARRSCGSARCSPRCSASTGCFRPTARTARSTC